MATPLLKIMLQLAIYNNHRIICTYFFRRFFIAFNRHNRHYCKFYHFYITLNNIYPTARDYYESTYQDGDWISIDLYFQSTWSSQNFQFTIGSFQYTYAYNSPTTYPLITGFCDDTPFQIKTLNFTLSLIPSEIQSSIILTSSNTNQGTVSIRNIYVSRIQCYSICTECTGPQYNQCTKCYYGLPTNNICPSCPSNQYYMKEDGCRNICDLRSPLYYDGFCQYYLVLYIDYGYLASEFTNPINLRWQLIYDPQHIDTTPTIINHIPSIFGIFKFNSGIYRYFTNVPDYQYSTYFIGLKISIVLFNDIPINCGIQFKINNIYYGSIYRNTSGIQTAKFTIFKTQAYDLYLTYSSVTSYELISYLDIPKQAFLVSAIGNYTDGTAGWGMAFIQISSGYCPLYCQLCEVPFICKTCVSGYYFYRDGTCISDCSSPYQRLNGSYCYDYDDETPYSQYLIQENIDQTGDPGYFVKYTLISQNGSNFLRGSDIYYSYWFVIANQLLSCYFSIFDDEQFLQ
ncbi:unnamed protein product [Paramecium octaurelia]|uniref:Uncharacterized protein n=1 Tax=Paramecium octaurelia TaxID=43137 RepID=A0A8S1WGY4_PAROT|nr:unnamed protein product [Paramecium octaurelia]